MYDINACRIDCHLVNLALSVAKILSIFSNGQTLPEKLYMCYNYGLVIFLENTLIHCYNVYHMFWFTIVQAYNSLKTDITYNDPV